MVYKAEGTKRFVALTFLPSSVMMSEAEKTRFVHEAQAAALNHPNLCTVCEIDESAGAKEKLTPALYSPSISASLASNAAIAASQCASSPLGEARRAS